MNKLELEQHFKIAKVGSRDLRLMTNYLRILGAATYKRSLHSDKEELASISGELRMVQKLLDLLDTSGDPCLVQTGPKN
jgi:translation initiation factor IF-1